MASSPYPTAVARELCEVPVHSRLRRIHSRFTRI